MNPNYNYKQLIILKSKYNINVFKDNLKSKKGFNITNDHVKPEGGLWTSSYNPEYKWLSDWGYWCNSEMPEWIGTDGILIDIKRTARIAQIKDMNDLKHFFKRYPFIRYTKDGWGNKEISHFNGRCLNYESMRKDFDIIHLTEQGQYKTRMPDASFYNLNLYGWDCESSLMLNNVINNFNKIQIKEVAA
jgi:hypothetical protein